MRASRLSVVSGAKEASAGELAGLAARPMAVGATLSAVGDGEVRSKSSGAGGGGGASWEVNTMAPNAASNRKTPMMVFFLSMRIEGKRKRESGRGERGGRGRRGNQKSV